jgi:hypothetical protein
MEIKDFVLVFFLLQLSHPGPLFRFGINWIAVQAARNQPIPASLAPIHSA